MTDIAVLAIALLIGLWIVLVFTIRRQRRPGPVASRSPEHEHLLWLLGALLDDERTVRLMVQTGSVGFGSVAGLRRDAGAMSHAELLATVAALLRDSRTRRIAANYLAQRTSIPTREARAMLWGLVAAVRG